MKYLLPLFILCFPSTALATTWNPDIWHFHFQVHRSRIHVREQNNNFCRFTATSDLVQPGYIDYFARVRCDGILFDVTVVDYDDPMDGETCSHTVTIESERVNMTYEDTYPCQ